MSIRDRSKAEILEQFRIAEAQIILVETRYNELVDALCSKAWMGRNRHESVVALAKRMKGRETKIIPLELEDVALAAGYCIRASGHTGPCNGLPRNDCFAVPEPGGTER